MHVPSSPHLFRVSYERAIFCVIAFALGQRPETASIRGKHTKFVDEALYSPIFTLSIFSHVEGRTLLIPKHAFGKKKKARFSDIRCMRSVRAVYMQGKEQSTMMYETHFQSSKKNKPNQTPPEQTKKNGWRAFIFIVIFVVVHIFLHCSIPFPKRKSDQIKRGESVQGCANT